MKNSSVRLKTFQTLLKKGVYVIEDPLMIFYLTGRALSLGQLCISKTKASLFVDGRYLFACKKQSPCSVQDREEFASFFQDEEEVYFDKDRCSFLQYQELKKLGLPLAPLENPAEKMRMIKEKGEIEAIKKSVALLAEGYRYAFSQLRIGITEVELARAFHIEMLRKGAQGLSFDPIIAFGRNSALPHHHPGESQLKQGDIVLMDMGVSVDDYASDMTRVSFFGPPNEQLLEIEKVVKEACFAAISGAQIGVKLGVLDQIAREEMRKKGLEKYFLHTLGHGIGLEVHENFRIKDGGKDHDICLEPHMVFTIEPGLYIEGIGGVRHEEMILMTEKGPEVLTIKL